MNKREREELISCIDDVRNSDDDIEALFSLYLTVKRLVHYDQSKA